MPPKRKHSFKGYKEPDEDYESMFREFDISRFLEDAATYKNDPRIPLGTPDYPLPRRVGTEEIRTEEYIALCRLLAAFPGYVTMAATGSVPRDQDWIADRARLPLALTQRATRGFVGFLCCAAGVGDGWARKIWPMKCEESWKKSRWKEADSVIHEVCDVLRRFWKGNEGERIEALSALREMVQEVFGFMPDM